jgi:hypothetical protein
MRIGQIVLCLIVGGISYLLWNFDDITDSALCAVTVHQTVPSPNARRNAVVFDHDCGAVTRFNTQLNIAYGGEQFYHYSIPSTLSIDGPHTLYLRWVSDTKLEVLVRPYWRIYRKDDRAGDVEIRYRSADGVPWLSNSAWDDKDDYAEYTSWPPRARRPRTAKELEQGTQK